MVPASEDPELRYQQWLLRHAPSGAELYRQRLAVNQLAYRPLVSIVVPVFETPPEFLRRMLRSVVHQTYPHWQLCLVDDGSAEPWIASRLARLAAADPRVRFHRRATNGGISAATNDALAMATGDLVAFIDHDDEIDLRTLYEVVRQFNAEPETDAVHFDLDLLWPSGRRSRPFFAPEWSPELLLSSPYIVHLVLRRRCLAAVGELRSECDGGQDFDFVLRLTETTDRIAHIPQVLYHWRVWASSASGGAKPYAYAARKRAVTDTLRRRGLAADCVDRRVGTVELHRVRYHVLNQPVVSVIVFAIDGSHSGTRPEVSTDRLAAWLSHLLRHTAYRPLEIVLAGRPAAIRPLAALLENDHGVIARSVACESADMGTVVNTAASAATGSHLLLLEPGLEPLDDKWLTSLLEYSQQSAIGAVGAQIYRPDGSVWHAGVIVPAGVPACVRQDIMHNPGEWPEALNVTNFSAISGGCVITRRSVFDEVGGFRPAADAGFSDVDYCLRVRQRSYRIVFTPFARLRHAHHPHPMFSSNGANIFRARWDGYTDPYHNPNLAPDGSFLAVEE